MKSSINSHHRLLKADLAAAGSLILVTKNTKNHREHNATASLRAFPIVVAFVKNFVDFVTLKSCNLLSLIMFIPHQGATIIDHKEYTIVKQKHIEQLTI